MRPFFNDMKPPFPPTAPQMPDLVDLAQIDPRLKLDIRYADSNNFAGKAVYPAPHGYLHRDAAHALRRAHDRAQAQGYGLQILDAYRPWQVTRYFWEHFPMHRAFLADPELGSRHNRGCAVDLTLFDLKSGQEVEMPSAYDEFTERAHPGYDGGTPLQRQMRDTLRNLMEAEGFSIHPHEWWHFDYRGWEHHPVLDIDFSDLNNPKKTKSP